MRRVFNETSINGMNLQNRLVRAATWEGMCAEDGRPTAKLAGYYGMLAQGGVGLLITGYAFIGTGGRQLPGQLGAHSDAFAEEMRALVDAVHRQGGKICLQLVHAGGQTTAKAAGRQPAAPSPVTAKQFPELPAELDAADIAELAHLFGTAARRGREWGFDAVELHA